MLPFFFSSPNFSTSGSDSVSIGSGNGDVGGAGAPAAASGAGGTAIGTGNQNTIDIMAGCATAGIAARLCGDLVQGGYSDWYLPSRDELSKLCLNRIAIGGFTQDWYWSSTKQPENEPQFPGKYAWYVSFYNSEVGFVNNHFTTTTCAVRAVRSF